MSVRVMNDAELYAARSEIVAIAEAVGRQDLPQTVRAVDGIISGHKSIGLLCHSGYGFDSDDFSARYLAGSEWNN